MKLISNLYVNKIDQCIDFYKKIGFKEIGSFVKNEKKINSTIIFNDSYIKLFWKKTKSSNSITLYFNKLEKIKILKIIEKFKFNGAKELWPLEETAIGHFYYQLKDPFGIIWNFQRYDINQPKIINIYSSQLASLMKLGFMNIYQREQRERHYYGNFVKNIESFNYVKFFKYNNTKIKGNYLLIDKLDYEYNKNLLGIAPNKLLINYGWNSQGQLKKDISGGSGFIWKYRNDVYKQYNVLIKSLANNKLINFKVAKKLGEKTNLENKKIINLHKEYFSKYKNKTIGFVSHWFSKNHYHYKKEYNPKKISIIAPSFIPFLYDEFEFRFPKIQDYEWQKKHFLKYGISDWDSFKTIEKFKNKFDILIYLKNDFINLSLKEINKSGIKSMLKKDSIFKIASYSDLNPAIKSLFGIEYFVKKLAKII